MDWIQTVILALVQGITEFLPISSSAHLILPAQLLGWVDQGLAFDVAVHVGTLLAVVWYFRQDLTVMAMAFVRSISQGQQTQDSRLAWFVIVGTIPAGVAGIALNDVVEGYFRSTLVIALATIFFGICLYVADRRAKHLRDVTSLTWRDVMIVGVAQALALIPGTSRSGITITAGLALGLTRTAAARFSFLLSVPIIAAAGLLKTVELSQSSIHVDWGTLLLGTVVAFVSAYLCIGWFLRILDRIGLLPFVIYRLALGAILLVFFL